MRENRRESAVHDTAVGAAADEPISNFDINIVPHAEAKINPNSYYSKEEFDRDRMPARDNDLNYFRTLAMNQRYFIPCCYGLSALLLKCEGGEYGCISS